MAIGAAVNQDDIGNLIPKDGAPTQIHRYRTVTTDAAC